MSIKSLQNRFNVPFAWVPKVSETVLAEKHHSSEKYSISWMIYLFIHLQQLLYPGEVAVNSEPILETLCLGIHPGLETGVSDHTKVYT